MLFPPIMNRTELQPDTGLTQGNRIWKNFIETAPGNAEPQLGTLLSTVQLGD